MTERRTALLRNVGTPVVALAALVGCRPDAAPARDGAEPPPAPSMAELAGAEYRGIHEGAVRLIDGRWQGEPFVPGGASRPTVRIVPGFRVTGDLDGDGVEEAAVLLTSEAGGSGTAVHLAVVARRGGDLVDLGTIPLGDRVQVRGADIEDGGLVVAELIEAGPDDAACCPGQKTKRIWTLGESGFREVASSDEGRLSLADLAGVDWVLTHLSIDEPVPEEIEITLRLEDGRIDGSSGCNRYFAEVSAGDRPDELSTGPVGSTRRACPEEILAVESRYQAALGSVSRFGFFAGRLSLTYRDAVLLFVERG